MSIRENNPFEGIKVGDIVEVWRVGCNASHIMGTVIPNAPEIQGKALTIDTGEREVKFVSKDGKPAERVEVPIHAVIYGNLGKSGAHDEICVTKVST